jgi:hypothetical protein
MIPMSEAASATLTTIAIAARIALAVDERDSPGRQLTTRNLR